MFEIISKSGIIESVMEKMPPIEKIYEAYSAIADGRVMLGDGRAEVASSDGSKIYNVSWNNSEYRSDDNATYWQGYPGYPVIAVLLLQRKLPYKETTAKLFAGIRWKELNERMKRNYAAAVGQVFDSLPCDEKTKGSIRKETEFIYSELTGLNITVRRGKTKNIRRKSKNV